ncbi:MAG: 50S ribosomal protein L4 [Spirochaetales bacterium]|nr:MAG: 50S ribosomal protein L4 [Spirochaetales bacterium]
MDKKVLSIEGKEVRTITLDDAVFDRDVSDGAIYHAVRNELANMRVGTAKTKTRSEVAGSHRKPWRQKGTGRARAGTYQSPVRVGGGVAFGPRPRDYSYKLPRKMKRAALVSLLSMKTKEDNLIVVEDFAVADGKTRELAKILTTLTGQERTVLILRDEDSLIKRAGRNIPWLSYLSYNRLRAHDLLYGRKLVVTESAANALNEFYGK